METQYRIKPCFLGYHLQFKSKFRFIFWNFTVWRYVPDSIVANVFKEKDCPFLYLPFTTSHCYYFFTNKKRADEFISRKININDILNKLKEEEKERKTTFYY